MALLPVKELTEIRDELRELKALLVQLVDIQLKALRGA